MRITLEIDQLEYVADLDRSMDISIPLISDAAGPKCFFAPAFKVEAVKTADFIGSVSAGSPVNFNNVMINPHGNGTHTECVGHLTAEPISIHECLTTFHFVARLISVYPILKTNGDKLITKEVLKEQLDSFKETDVVIVRTIPNLASKKITDYSGTNPPYFSKDAISYLNERNIIHLITDLPSIDKEEDGGKLEGHKTFWSYPYLNDKKKTITELVYIDNIIKDGIYLCNIQITSMMNDASPSKIVLFELNKK